MPGIPADPSQPFLVPFKRNPDFVGRTVDLERLHQALQNPTPTGIVPAGVTGMGGIGKTQLAVEYIYRYRYYYPDGIFWVNASQPLTQEFARLGDTVRHLPGAPAKSIPLPELRQTLVDYFGKDDLILLCKDLGVDHEELAGRKSIMAQEMIDYCERQGKLAELIQAVQRRHPHIELLLDRLIAIAFATLRQWPRSLLVLDNLADTAVLSQPLSQDLIAANLPCRLLFTTRQHYLNTFQTIALTLLPEGVALQLLLRHPQRQAVVQRGHPEHQVARQICSMLGYLPLALEVAGAHLGQRPGVPVAKYKEELEKRGALPVLHDDRIPVTTRHDAGLAAALASQWDHLQSSEAKRLLLVAGQLPEAAQIPVARLGLLAGVPEASGSFFDVTLEQALRELEDASLAEELVEERVRLHPLVREFAERQTPPAEKEVFCKQCALNLTNAYEDFATLEAHCAQRRVDALQEDLLTGLELVRQERPNTTGKKIGVPPWWLETRAADPIGELQVTGQDEAVSPRLQMLLRLLQREAHNLRDREQKWWSDRFRQQIFYRAWRMEIKSLLAGANQHLRQISRPYLLPRWSTTQESPALERSLIDHEDWVNTVVVTPDGQRAVSASSDHSLKVWDLVTGQAGRTLAGHKGGVNAVAVTPDGQRAISASSDHSLKVWDLATGQAERTLAGHKGSVRAVTVTPDGQHAISASSDRSLKVWDLATGQEEFSLTGHKDWVRAVVVTPDGQRAISAPSDRSLIVWNLVTGQAERTLASHKGWVWAVTITPDGQRAVSASSDRSLIVWDLATGQAERTLAGHKSWVRAVTVTPDGQRAISVASDRSLKVWDLATGQEVTSIILDGSLWSLAIAPDGVTLVTGDDAGNVYCLRVVEPGEI